MPRSLFLSLFSFPQSVGPMPVRGIDHGGMQVAIGSSAVFFFSFALFFCHAVLVAIALWIA
jgi:hypothetical protein